MEIEQLRTRLIAINDSANSLRAKAAAEKRDLTVEEEKELNSLLEDFERTETRIDQLTRLEAQSAKLNTPNGRQTIATQPTELIVNQDTGNALRTNPNENPRGNGTPRGASDPRLPATAMGRLERNGGFHSLGDMALAVRRAALTGSMGRMDPRLERLATATTFGNEVSGSDGGFAVPPDFRTAIMETIMGEDSLLSRCDQITTVGNSFTCPVDETSPWQTSGGITVTWDAEAASANQSKPQLKERTVKLNKLRALVPMTEELLEDASAVDAYLRKKAPEKISFSINNAIVNGSGTGIPLGILNSGALLVVAKESGQQSNTLVASNIMKMWMSMYGPSRSKAVWLVNQSVEFQLMRMSQPGTDNTGNFVTGWGVGVPLYMPAGGLSASPYATLFGRPVIPTQACPALTSQGDIIFADLTQYLALLKSGPNPRVDVSMHLWFDQDLIAFKFVLRMGGTTWWSQVLTPLNGSQDYSPYVCVAVR